MKKLLAFLFLFCPLMMFFSSCNCSSYGLEEFLYRTNAVVNRTEKLWNLSSPLIANSEDTAIFSKVSGKKFSVLIMTDVHFGGENNGNNGARQDTLFLSWLENYKSLMESAGTPELYPSFAICLGDVAEHGYEEEFIRYQVFTSLMNTEKYGNIKTFNVVGNKLNAILNQRSQDMLTANNWNVCQYAILVHMFARASGLEVGELVHVIADAHIYDRHIPLVKEIMEHEQFEAPKLEIDPTIKDFYDFTVDSFNLVDYKYSDKKYKIEVAV